MSDCLKDKTQMSCFQQDKYGGDGNGMSYWYDGNAFVGYRLYREVIKCETRTKVKQKGSFSLPVLSAQWETMATNLEEFHKVKDNFLCSKITSEVAVGRKIESDAIPVLEKLQKKEERLLKRKHREDMLLNDYKKSCIVGITRTCRIRAAVNYTFEEYSRAIDDAIRISRNVNGTDEKKRSRKDVSTSENLDARMKSEDTSGTSGECSNDGSGMNSRKEVDLDSGDNIDNKDYEDKDGGGDNDSDSDYSDAEEKNEMIHSKIVTVLEKPAAGVCSKSLDRSKNHLSNENRKVGAKSRLRHRPVLNSAIDPAVGSDSDDEN